ncbi:MAG: Holliday junction resolvase RuvX [Chloroflexi bacterium]|nr:Holliday junction resolvase RuvX [Chloroflexota bacterium]
MRVLGLDVGRRRIGVAVSDPSQLIAQSLETVLADSAAKAIQRIARLAEDYQVGRIVVGLPLRMDGSEGEQAGHVRHFAAKLGQVVRVPIVFWDERLSTVEAERLMIEAGVKREHRRRRIDAFAAAIILQEYLDSQPRVGSAAPDS